MSSNAGWFPIYFELTFNLLRVKFRSLSASSTTTTSRESIKSMHKNNNKFETHPNRQARVADVATLATSSTIAKNAREARNRGNRVPNKRVDPCETCGKKSHTTQECYSGANWANRSQWWKTQDYSAEQHPNNPATTRSIH